MLHAELLRGYPSARAEALYHVAAIGKARFLTDIAKIEIGESEQLLRLKNAHFLHVFLTAFPVDGEERFREI